MLCYVCDFERLKDFKEQNGEVNVSHLSVHVAQICVELFQVRQSCRVTWLHTEINK